MQLSSKTTNQLAFLIGIGNERHAELTLFDWEINTETPDELVQLIRWAMVDVIADEQ